MTCTCDGGPGPEGQHQWYCGLDPDEIEHMAWSETEEQQARGKRP